MNVKLISVTAAMIKIRGEVLSPDELIVYIARVSNPGNQDNMETAPKLLAFLIRKKHWSPFEMADMCVEIVTSRAIAQQILRHRSFSFQEFSQRYAVVTEFEPVQLRKQAEKNRQSSTEVFNPIVAFVEDWTSTEFSGNSKDMIQSHLTNSKRLYDDLIKEGVAKESARMVLPLTTQTTLYMKGSVRSWIHYLQQRTDEHTQLEHREIALAIQDIFKVEYPNVFGALKEI